MEGKHVIQYGMNSYCFGEELYDEVMKEGGYVYHIHEIERDGVKATFDRIYENLKDIDLVYISFDIDTFDASYAPGTGSSTFSGSTPRELMPYLRQFTTKKDGRWDGHRRIQPALRQSRVSRLHASCAAQC